MNFGDWKAQLNTMPGRTYIDLWLYRRIGKDTEILVHDGTIKTIKEGTPTNSEDYFVRFEDYGQLKIVADAFADFGVKDKNDYKNQGLLEAKDNHLQDMRQLVFELIKQSTDTIVKSKS